MTEYEYLMEKRAANIAASMEKEALFRGKVLTALADPVLKGGLSREAVAELLSKVNAPMRALKNVAGGGKNKLKELMGGLPAPEVLEPYAGELKALASPGRGRILRDALAPSKSGELLRELRKARMSSGAEGSDLPALLSEATGAKATYTRPSAAGHAYWKARKGLRDALLYGRQHPGAVGFGGGVALGELDNYLTNYAGSPSESASTDIQAPKKKESKKS